MRVRADMARLWTGAGRLLAWLLGASDGVARTFAIADLGALAHKLERTIVRPQFQGPIEVGDRAAVLVQRVKGDRAVDVGVGEIGFQPDRAIVVPDRLPPFVALRQELAAPHEGLGIIRPELE